MALTPSQHFSRESRGVLVVFIGSPMEEIVNQNQVSSIGSQLQGSPLEFVQGHIDVYRFSFELVLDFVRLVVHKLQKEFISRSIEVHQGFAPGVKQFGLKTTIRREIKIIINFGT